MMTSVWPSRAEGKLNWGVSNQKGSRADAGYFAGGASAGT